MCAALFSPRWVLIMCPIRVALLHRFVLFNQSFSEALEAYGEAIELDDTNMSFVSNRAAVYFEQKEYEACITEVSREV